MEEEISITNEILEESKIIFLEPQNTTPILELKANGDILVKGKLIENDIEVVDALREFIKNQT